MAAPSGGGFWQGCESLLESAEGEFRLGENDAPLAGERVLQQQVAGLGVPHVEIRR